MFAASPLRLLTPANHGNSAWVYASSYGGGLVGGDAIRLAVDVARGAAAFISTQSSTKAYRSTLGSSTSLDALVGDGGLLVISPDPVVCFAGSSYRQSQHVDLSGTGALVLVDWLSSGRYAAGERWAFDRYSSRTTVRVDGRLVFYDGLSLDSTDGDLVDRMGRFDVLATVLIVGTPVSTAADSHLGGRSTGTVGTTRGSTQRGITRIQPGNRIATGGRVGRADRPDHSAASRVRAGAARR